VLVCTSMGDWRRWTGVENSASRVQILDSLLGISGVCPDDFVVSGVCNHVLQLNHALWAKDTKLFCTLLGKTSWSSM